MLKQTNVPTITKAVEVIYNYSADARMMELYRSREKRLHDEASQMEAARNEGIAQGRAEGRAEGVAEGIEKGRAEIEANLRRMGMSQEQIDEALGRKA